MSTLQKLSLALVGTTGFFMSANPAGAVSLTIGNSISVPGEGQKTNTSGTKTIDFNSGKPIDPNGFATYSGSNTIVKGSITNQYAAPLDDNSYYLTVAPPNLQNIAGSGDETISFANPIDYFGFYWGSIDAYNYVSVYSGSNLIKTFNGTNVPGALANGNQTSTANNFYVNLLADTSKGETFDKVVFSSTGIAFETDNHSYRLASVPEPTSILGLLAFGVVSAGSFLKRKSKLV